MRTIPVPQPVVEIVERLESKGFETWAVGGAVRDALLGTHRGDWDLATRARPGDVQRLFRRTVPVGVDHGTVGVFGSDEVLYEVTTFRRDVETFGRKAVVSFSDTIEEDLSRRDFTINALAWHPLKREFRDPYGGVEDLEARVLRAVGNANERFEEDYLRVLRALRFAGRLGLLIEESTWEGLVDAVPSLGTLSRERIREEIGKVMIQGPAAGSLRLYRDSGALREILPDFTNPLDEEALAAIEAADASRPLIRTGLLLSYGLGERARNPQRADPPGDRSGKARDPYQDLAGFMAAQLEALRFSTQEARRLVALVCGGRDPRGALKDDRERRAWMSATGSQHIPDIIRMWLAVQRGRLSSSPDTARDHGELSEVIRLIREDVRCRIPLRVGDLAIGGKDLMELGVRPGPVMGGVLRALLVEVWDRPSFNHPNRLRERAMQIIAEGIGE